MTTDLDTAYQDWTKTGGRDSRGILAAAQKTIEASVRAYAPDAGPVARSHGKLLALEAVKSYDPGKGTKLRTHII